MRIPEGAPFKTTPPVVSVVVKLTWLGEMNHDGHDNHDMEGESRPHRIKATVSSHALAAIASLPQSL